MIRKILRRLGRVAMQVGYGPFWYFRDLLRYVWAARQYSSVAAFYLFPKIFDATPSSHTFDKHYIYMDRWAFKALQRCKPEAHVDVGSSISFLAVASTVTRLTFVDIRPVEVDFDNFSYMNGDVLRLPFANNSVRSLSCLHVAEHVGLGRYGDVLDPSGTSRACRELARVLAPGGMLYFAVPVGLEAVYFNAHRVHQPQTILDYFSDLELVEFAVVNDAGHFVSPAQIGDYRDAQYACGCFRFTKV